MHQCCMKPRERKNSYKRRKAVEREEGAQKDGNLVDINILGSDS